ncbi:MAG: CinA family protein, partial [Clostridia bacterium]|nr:CinA family protein [Clostridia bacterium]
VDAPAKPSDFIKILNKKYENKFDKAFIKTVGAPEEVVSVALGKAKKLCESLGFNVKDRFGDCTVEIVYDAALPKSVYDGVMRTLVSELKDYIYALEDITLEERLFQLLKLRRMKISVAESFTGGGVSKRLVSVSGVSEVFFEGLNTYSNEAKAERLGVETETLRRYGAVSKETAYEMAAGLIAGGNCDVAVATTGIAGPKSDNTLKPVGLLYIAVGKRDGISVFEYNLKGSRESITEMAINLALFLAYKLLK